MDDFDIDVIWPIPPPPSLMQLDLNVPMICYLFKSRFYLYFTDLFCLGQPNAFYRQEPVSLP